MNTNRQKAQEIYIAKLERSKQWLKSFRNIDDEIKLIKEDIEKGMDII